ncbi:MAG TPA: hypothetical protein VGP53_06725 [Acidimicrobiales bacterium]|nr:hypothetical protein [Acidimicrobiales bacterium]
MTRRLLVALAVVLAGASTACADDVAPAARIGDRTITHDELLDEVDEWAGNTQTQRAEQLAAVAVPAGYAIDPVISILQDRITFEIAGRAFDDLGLVLDDELLAQAASFFFGEDPAAAAAAQAGFSEAYASFYVEGLARGLAVQTELGEEAFAQLILNAGRDVEVNPRYGEWDASRLSIIGPSGPRAAPGSDLFVEL